MSAFSIDLSSWGRSAEVRKKSSRRRRPSLFGGDRALRDIRLAAIVDWLEQRELLTAVVTTMGSTTQAGGNTNSLTLSLASAGAGVGDLVVVSLQVETASKETNIAITDSGGNTWNLQTNAYQTATPNGTQDLIFWSVLTNALTKNSSTIQFSYPSGAVSEEAAAYDVTGLGHASVDTSATASGTAASGAASTTVTAGEFAFESFGMRNNNSNIGVATGFTAGLKSSVGATSLADEYNTATSGGTLTPTATFSASSAFATGLVVFKSSITEFPITTANSGSESIVTGPDGNLWFTEGTANKIGKMTTAGVVTEYTLASATSRPQFINTGPDGALWFTEINGNKIGRITTAGVITEFTVPTTGSGPNVITTGPDGALWFTEFNTGKIGRITTAGVFSEYPTSASNTQPTDIIVGPDGALWFANYNTGTIGRITTAGVETEFPTTATDSKPTTLALGSDGAFWIAESNKGIIARMTTAGAITTFTPTLPGGSTLYDIVPGPDGNLWFTVYGGGAPNNLIGQITTAGVVTYFTIPTIQSTPQVITTGPDNAMWFVEQASNNIGRLALSPRVLTVDTASDVSDGTTTSITALLANKGSDGRISLREAIQAIDNTPNSGTPYQIIFNIPGSGVQTINVTSPLPQITQPVIIDATTQPGYAGTPLIQLNGAGNVQGTNGLEINAASTTVKGFSIYGFSGNAIQVDAVASSVIQSNYLGLYAGGGVAPSNGTGVVLAGATGALVGGLVAGDGNVISGNYSGGVQIEAGASGNTIEGNFIGTNVTGTAAIANSGYGIEITASTSNTIGGTVAGAANLISGNTGVGIWVQGSTSKTNSIIGNKIGTTLDGTTALGNGGNGISIDAASGTMINGVNVVSANGGAGISLINGATGTAIENNLIGTAIDATSALGNGGDGIVFDTNATSNTVGGTTAGQGDTIAFNGGAGIDVKSGGKDAFEGNSIFSNVGLGIDLNNDGVSPNSGTLSSNAPNGLMNYPVFTKVYLVGNTLSVTGYIGTSGSQLVFSFNRVEIFIPDNDPSGHGEGKVYLGHVSTGLGSSFSGSFTVSGLAVGDLITGTATDVVNDTSEFAANAAITLAPTTTVVTSGTNPSVYGQSVTFTATTTGTGGTPTGTETFLDGTTVLGTATLSGGTATFTTTSLGAGSHSITVQYGGDVSYATSTSAAITQTVTPAPLTVSVTNLSEIYGSAPPWSVNLVVSGLVNGDTYSIFSGSPNLAAGPTSNVGSYPVTQGTFTAGANYSLTFNPGTLTITPAPLVVTANPQTKLYGAADPALTFAATGLVNGDTTAIFTGGLTTTATAASNVGLYGITQGTLSAGSNYTVTYHAANLTVTPAVLNVSAFSQSKVYGAALPALLYSYAGLVNGDTPSVFSGSLTTTATASSIVGAYPISQGTFSAGTNYSIAFTTGTITITTATLTVTATNKSKFYGAALPALTYTVAGLVNGDTSAVLSGALTTIASASSGVGSYAITRGTLVVVSNYTIAFNPGTLSVTPVALTVTATNTSKLYGAALPSLTFTATGLVNGDTNAALTGALATTATASSVVGTYPITQGTLADPNYTITFTAGVLTVTPAALLVAGVNVGKIYGAALPALTYTYSGLVNGDTSSVFSGSLTTTATASSSVGAYPINKGTLAAGSNYTISYTVATLNVTAATLTVTAANKSKLYGAAVPALTYTLAGLVNGDTSSVVSGALTTTANASAAVGSYAIARGTLVVVSNYTISFKPGTLTVTPVALAVTATTTSKIYGAAIPSLTVTATGFVNGDTTAALTGALTTTATTSSVVGAYPITQGTLADPNYTITFTAGVLNVTRASLLVAGVNAGKIYGAALPALTFTDSGLVNGDTSSVFSGSLTTTGTAASNVGAYPINQGTLSAGSNYTITYTAATLNVTAATLNVTAGNLSKAYGSAMPTLTFTTSGLVNGDTTTIFTGSLTTTATAASSAGTYPITQGTLNAGPNYNVAFNPGTFTVTQAVLTITAQNLGKVYGAGLPALTYSYAGLVNGDTSSVISGALTTVATASSIVGGYAITQGTIAAANYTVAFTPGVLNVTPATLTVSGVNTSKIYGAAVPGLAYTYAGLVNGDTSSVIAGSPTTIATASSGVGAYPITQGNLSAGSNYAISYTAATLNVTPAALTVTGINADKIYGDALPAFTYTYSGLVNGDTSSVFSGSLNSTASASSNIGAYPITQGTLSAANYAISYTAATLNITPAALTVTADSLSKLYGVAVPTLTYTYTGLVNRDTSAIFTGALATTAIASSGLGVYPVTQGTLSAGSNYALTFNPGTLTVTKAVLTVTAQNQSMVYGSAFPAFTYTYTGLIGGDTAAVISGALTTLANARSGVGAYAITQGTLTATNYTVAFTPGVLSVTPAPLTVSAVNTSKTYGATLSTLPYTYAGLVNGDTSSVFSGSLTTTASASSNVGAYPINEGTLSAANYTISYTGGTLNVTPAALSVTADNLSKEYGAAVPSLTFTTSGLANGDTTSIVNGALTTTANALSNLGLYPITQGTLSAGANYTIAFNPGTLTVTQAILTITAQNVSMVYGSAFPSLTYTYAGLIGGDTASVITGALTTVANASSGVGGYAITQGTLTAANYIVAFNPGVINVTPAPLTVSGVNASKIYGDPVPSLTYTYSGLVNGDTSSVFSGTLTTTASASSNVGGYPISQENLSAGSNYAISYNPATLSITPAALNVTADRLTKTYGATVPSLTYTYAGLVNGDTSSVFSGSLATAATAATGVGVYSITQGTLTAGPDYFIGFNAGTLTVGKAILNISAHNLNKVYGAGLPILSYNYAGLVNGDTATVLSGSLTTTASISSGVGVYPINQGTLSAANYVLAFTPGILNVTPAALIVSADAESKIYGAPVPTFNYSFAGLVNGDTPSIFQGALSTTATANSPVGNYGIGQGTLTVDSNYLITFIPGTLNVTPAPLTVSADAESKIYGAANPPLTISYAGLVSGDTSAVFTGSLSTTATSNSGVGHYAIARGTLSAGSNYLIHFNAGTLSVTPASLIVTAVAASRNFAAPDPVFSVQYSGFVNSDGPGSLAGTLHFTTTDTTASPVGSYPITPGGLISSNYVITFVDGALTVNPASVSAQGKPVSAREGVEFAGEVAFFSVSGSSPHPELFSATIQWGDGQVSAGIVTFDGSRGVYAINGINTYQLQGVYAIQVAIQAGGVDAAKVNGISVVNDVPLTVSGTDIKSTMDEPYVGTLAKIVDANPFSKPSDYTVTIDWGDGEITLGTVGASTGDGFPTLGVHTFNTVGTFHVLITITELHGSETSTGIHALVVSPLTTTSPSTSSSTPGGTTSGQALNLAGGALTTPDGVSRIVLTNVPAVLPPSNSSTTGVNIGGAGPKVQATNRAPATPPGFFGPLVVAPAPIGFGSGGTPGPGPAPSASTGGSTGASSNAAAAVGGVSAAGGGGPQAIQAALQAAIESVSQQLSALARAGASTTVRTAMEFKQGTEIRNIAAKLAPFSNFLWGQLDDLDKKSSTEMSEKQVVGVVGTGLVAYAGYVLLNSRVGYLVLSLLTARPLWGQVDPLAVLMDWEQEAKRNGKSSDDEEEESLQSLIQENQERERDEEGNAHDAPQPGAHESDGQPAVRRQRGRALSRSRSRRTQGTQGAL